MLLLMLPSILCRILVAGRTGRSLQCRGKPCAAGSMDGVEIR